MSNHTEGHPERLLERECERDPDWAELACLQQVQIQTGSRGAAP